MKDKTIDMDFKKDNGFDKRLDFQCMWMHDEAMRRSSFDDECIGGLITMGMSRVGWLICGDFYDAYTFFKQYYLDPRMAEDHINGICELVIQELIKHDNVFNWSYNGIRHGYTNEDNVCLFAYRKYRL